MKVVDTNVFSELLKPRREQRVVDWMDRQPPESLYLCAMSVAEVLTGIVKMPQGHRRDCVQEGSQLLLRRFEGRILPFDEKAASKYAEIQGALKAKGEAISVPDCLIASVAAANGFAVATRDVQPFRAAGLEVINPWE